MKYWYISVVTSSSAGWRVWRGNHPVERIKQYPDEIMTWFTEITVEQAIAGGIKLREGTPSESGGE